MSKSHHVDSAIKNLIEYRRASLERGDEVGGRRQLYEVLACVRKLL